MNNYLINGDHVSIVPEGAMEVTHKLPVGIYTINLQPMQPPMLVRISDMSVPEKLYGDTCKHTTRIINTFHDRTKSTGVLLAGTKGAGKTLLARNISVTLYKEGIPTIVVPFNLICPAVAEFIEKIDTECMVLFDEIDKITGEDADEIRSNTNCMLGLFDGLSENKRLYILTANDTDKINRQFLNRPGRIYYKILFGGVTQEAIKQYCEENLNNKEHIKDMMHIATLIRDFSFDILQAIVEECNRYDMSPRAVCKILNVSPELRGDFKIQVFGADGHEYEMTTYGKYQYMDFDANDNYTEIQFYDPVHGQKRFEEDCKNNEERASELKVRYATDPEFAKRYSRYTLHINDVSFKRIEHGALIYEQDGYTIRCTPVGSHSYLAF